MTATPDTTRRMGHEAEPGALVHEQVTVEHDGRSAEVDAGIAPLVLACWLDGLETVASCEEVDTGDAFIAFPTREEALLFAWHAGPGVLLDTDTSADGTPARMARILVSEEEPGQWTGQLTLGDIPEGEAVRAWRLVTQRGVEMDAAGFGHDVEDEGACFYAVSFPTRDLRDLLATIEELEAAE